MASPTCLAANPRTFESQAAEDARQNALNPIRPLVESVGLHPKARTGRFSVELAGDLLAIFGPGSENVISVLPDTG